MIKLLKDAFNENKSVVVYTVYKVGIIHSHTLLNSYVCENLNQVKELMFAFNLKLKTTRTQDTFSSYDIMLGIFDVDDVKDLDEFKTNFEHAKEFVYNNSTIIDAEKSVKNLKPRQILR